MRGRWALLKCVRGGGEIKAEDDGSVNAEGTGHVLSWWWFCPQAFLRAFLRRNHCQTLTGSIFTGHKTFSFPKPFPQVIILRFKGKLRQNHHRSRGVQLSPVFSAHSDVQEKPMRASLCCCFPSAILVSHQDVKSAGMVQPDSQGAIPTLPKGGLVEFSYDSFQENDGATSPFTSTLPDMRDDWKSEDEGAGGCRGKKSPGEKASSEEEGEAGEKSCEMTWKKSQRLADGLMRFSIDLLREVQLESNRTNVILSPLSIALALSHLALGNS